MKDYKVTAYVFDSKTNSKSVEEIKYFSKYSEAQEYALEKYGAKNWWKPEDSFLIMAGEAKDNYVITIS